MQRSNVAGTAYPTQGRSIYTNSPSVSGNLYNSQAPRVTTASSNVESLISGMTNISITPDDSRVILNKLLRDLNDRINHYLQTNNNIEKQRSDILKWALNYLRNMKPEGNDNAELLDLYLTINNILNICRQKSSLSSELIIFFGSREDMLRGDTHDYCYQATLANRFCRNVAEVAFPDVAPLDVLLYKAKTVNRDKPWRDETTLEESIDSEISFFRTSDNSIHLYQAVLDRAIANLNRGNLSINTIWYGTDTKNLKPLDHFALEVLKQRSPTFKELIQYTEQLFTASGEIAKQFAALRLGLQESDMNHQGSEDRAGGSAYLAVEQFFEWWNNLENTKKGQQIKSRIKEIRSLAKYIDDLSKAEDTCTWILGNKLELLTLFKKNNLLSIEMASNVYLSSNDLNQMKKQIEEELKIFRPINTNANIFAMLAQSKSFIDRLVKSTEKILNYDDIVSKEYQFNNIDCLSTSHDSISDYQSIPIQKPEKKHGLTHSFFKHVKNIIINKIEQMEVDTLPANRI